MKGIAELCLLVAVCASCWTRTPVGAAARAVVALARDEPLPDLVASFRTELPPALQRSLARSLQQRDDALLQPPATSTEVAGWTPALRTAVAAHLGDDALARLDVEAARSTTAFRPESALERFAVGAELQERAIRRARAAGVQQPGRYHAHRRFLPDDAALAADEAVDETLALATVLDLSWPVDADARITSGFGYRTHPTLHTRKLHEGVDIAVPVGTPVAAAGSGTVLRAGSDAICGRHVKLDHGHGVTTSYCHGSEVEVDRGARVEGGDEIMRSGNTGRSTGPHLHFGLRVGGRPVDPGAFRTRVGATAGEAAATAHDDATSG